MLLVLSGSFLYLDNAYCAKSRAYIVPVSQSVVDGSKIRHRPGLVIAVKAGKRETLKIINFKGTASKPITVKNLGGVVDVSNSNRGYAIAIQGCKHLRFSGTGKKGVGLGFRCKTARKGMMAFHINGKSSNIEVDHVEVYGAGFAGFNVKDEPREDKSTNRGNFVMYDISLHDNYVHDTKGEGFYIGHTFYDGWKNPKTGNVLYPHVIKGLRLYNNIIKNTGCEGIQVGSAPEDVEIFNNLIIGTGKSPFAKWQNNGVQIGKPTTGRIFNNVIIDVPATGFVVWGDGTNHFFNNVIANVGGYGVYVHAQKGSGYVFANNTIVNAAKGGLRFNKSDTDKFIVINNIIVLPKGGQPVQAAAGKLKAAYNLTLKSARAAGFMAPTKHDYRLKKTSPARGKGKQLKSSRILTDLTGNKRPTSRIDLGAYQYSSGQSETEFSLDRLPGKVEPGEFTDKRSNQDKAR